MKTMKSTLESLNEPIYVGKRLHDNLRALTWASTLTALLGLVLVIADTISGAHPVIICVAWLTLAAGVACGICAGVLKNREVAVLIPTLFCAVVFTVYGLTGLGDGSLYFWSLLLPIGMSYFVSVRSGAILSAYYTLLSCLLFYTPLGANLTSHYPASFVARFPLLYAAISTFTVVAMIQYHRGALFEMEHAGKLASEVARQTAAATRRAERLQVMSDEMVQLLAASIDAKDRYTNGHSTRVSWYAEALARQLGWPDAEVEALRREALLHDVGKMGVPDAILNKPGRLTNEEFETIKTHTTTGGTILARSGALTGASEVARSHHERYDGTGYPDGLSGDEIPAHARLVAVADAYDAMRSDRVYRKGLAPEVIREELVRGRGTQFDPAYLDAFLQLADAGARDEIAEREIPQL